MGRERTQALRSCVVELNVAIELFIDDKAMDGHYFAAGPGFGKRIRAMVLASAARPSLGAAKKSSLERCKGSWVKK